MAIGSCAEFESLVRTEFAFIFEDRLASIIHRESNASGSKCLLVAKGRGFRVQFALVLFDVEVEVGDLSGLHWFPLRSLVHFVTDAPVDAMRTLQEIDAADFSVEGELRSQAALARPHWESIRRLVYPGGDPEWRERYTAYRDRRVAEFGRQYEASQLGHQNGVYSRSSA